MALPPGIATFRSIAVGVQTVVDDLAAAEAKIARLRALLVRVVTVGDAMAAAIDEFRDTGVAQSQAGNAAADAWLAWRADQAGEG